LRVVVAGNSVSVLVRPNPPGDDNLTYARHLERALRERGRAAEVRNEGRWFEMVDHCFARWESGIAASMPDVVVLNFGFVECQPAVLPHPVHRWVLAWNTGLGPVRARVEQPVRVAARRALGWWIPRYVAWLGERGHKRSPARFAAEMRRFIRNTHTELGAAVLVLEITPPSGWVLGYLPGIEGRVAAYNRILAEVVAEAGDPAVRLVPLHTVVDALGDRTSGDGIHFTPAAHRMVGDLLADHTLAALPPP
jgi:lysophospholipase L1-like esterase